MNGQGQQPWPGQGYPQQQQQPVRIPQQYPQQMPGQMPGQMQQQPMPGQMPQQQRALPVQGMTKTKSFIYGLLGFIAFCFIMFLISLATFYFKYVRK